MVANQEIFFKPLIFDTSIVDLSGLNLPSKVIDPNGNLLLYVDPNKYASVSINQGSNFIPTGGPSYLDIALVRKGFRVTIDYEESIIRHAVHKLAKAALVKRCFIAVRDFVGPEADDIATQVIQVGSQLPRTRVMEAGSSTLRTGIIQAPFDYGGSIGDTLPGGFSFTFIEKGLRYI